MSTNQNLSRADKISLLYNAGYTFGVLTIISPAGHGHIEIDDAVAEALHDAS